MTRSTSLCLTWWIATQYRKFQTSKYTLTSKIKHQCDLFSGSEANYSGSEANYLIEEPQHQNHNRQEIDELDIDSERYRDVPLSMSTQHENGVDHEQSLSAALAQLEQQQRQTRSSRQAMPRLRLNHTLVAARLLKTLFTTFATLPSISSSMSQSSRRALALEDTTCLSGGSYVKMDISHKCTTSLISRF